ncbi:MAG: glycosyltransferase family 2 protein [Chitinophagaceae bacterium]|nr:glycosyltransferase family 2 protein [Chitinophagaceae bacterium]
MCFISICVTTYNRAATLSHTIDSILRQTYTDFELIISDDNSQDDTQKICEEYCRKDKRVKYYRNAVNLKMPGNLNNAISKASGEYIANLHDGDVYRADLIEKWHTTLCAHPDALFVFNQYNWLDENGRFKFKYDHHLSEVNDGIVLMEYFLQTLSSAPWGTVMARKKAYDQLGLFDGSYGFISDVEMWLRLGLNGKVCYVNEALIDLTPREKEHPYYLPHWKIFCLNTTILFKYYLLYSEKYPLLKDKFPVKNLFDRLGKEAFRTMAVLLKHGSYARLREGVYVLRQLTFSPFKRVRMMFCFIRPLIPAYKNEINNLYKLLKKVNLG